MLNEFEGQLATPILFKELYDGAHYPTFNDIMTDEKLKNLYLQEIKTLIAKKRKDDEMCLKCHWHFESDADKTKHRRYCREL